MTSPDQNYTSWHVGMKVVCVDVEDFEGVLELDHIYTIRRMGCGVGMFKGVLGMFAIVAVSEADNPDDEYFQNAPGFCVARFRPVQTRKTSIEVFTAMLSPKPAKAKKVRA
nr:hypothetical protein RAR13_11710 [Aminobacter aminovorans]